MDSLDILKDDLLNYSDMNIPDITSSDKDERKSARRIRIHKRDELYKRQRATFGKHVLDETKPDKPTLLQQQLEKSSEILKQLFMEVEEQVTNIRVANDAREVERREKDGINQVKIMNQLEEDARLSGEMFEEISSKWVNILKYNDPLNIHEEIQSQKEKCDEVIKQKNTVIEMLRNELKTAALSFYKEQMIQDEDIKMLAKRVEKQVVSMRTAHRNELQNIEDVMIQERTNMMTNNDKRWEDLYRKRREQELAISANKIRQKSEFEDKVSKVRMEHYERIREVKIRMERDCESLQREFQRIKAIALENCEKIDYNYQILKKREDENLIIKSTQKRKLNKLRDMVNSLRKKSDTYKETTDTEINKLLNEVLALQKSISGVNDKCATLTEANDLRYMQVWDLNRRESSKLLAKLLTIDRLLHEQQLGLQWEEPVAKIMKKNKLPSYNEAKRTMSALKETSMLSKRNNYNNSEYTSAYKRIMVTILTKIADKSSFIMEKRLKQILESMDSKETQLVQIDNVFHGLNITNTLDLKILYQYLMPYIKCPICSSMKSTLTVNNSPKIDILTEDSSTWSDELDLSEISETKSLLRAVRESDSVINDIVTQLVDPSRIPEEGPELLTYEGECLGPKISKPENYKNAKPSSEIAISKQWETGRICINSHPLFIETAHILKGFREFVTDYYCADTKETQLSSSVLVVNPTISRFLTTKDVQAYWESYKNVFGQNKIDLWNSLYYAMQKYHAILEDRHNLHNTLQCVRKQNLELKHLLKRYRNDEDMKPPCAQQREQPISGVSRLISCKSVGSKK